MTMQTRHWQRRRQPVAAGGFPFGDVRVPLVHRGFARDELVDPGAIDVFRRVEIGGSPVGPNLWNVTYCSTVASKIAPSRSEFLRMRNEHR